jgi:hypothetical protein
VARVYAGSSGRILYPRANQLFVRAADGHERSVFVSDHGSPPTMPDVCRDDGAIVFVWPFRNGATTQNVWRINANGTEPRQLTDVARAFGPTCSADGQRVACLGAAQTFRIQKSGGFAGDSEATTPISNVVLALRQFGHGAGGNPRGGHSKGGALVLVTPGFSDRGVLNAGAVFSRGEVRLTNVTNVD